MTNRHTDSILTSVITAFVANESIHFAEKIVSVLLLAMITEIGRQAITAVVAKIARKRNKS